MDKKAQFIKASREAKRAAAEVSQLVAKTGKYQQGYAEIEALNLATEQLKEIRQWLEKRQ